MQYQNRQIVLVDTNIIIEAHRTEWRKPICDFYNECFEMSAETFPRGQLSKHVVALYFYSEN